MNMGDDKPVASHGMPGRLPKRTTSSNAGSLRASSTAPAPRPTEQGFARLPLRPGSRSSLYEFTWYEFCDWYLELAKPVLQGDDANAAASARRTLLDVFEALLRALHPLMPFITEEIWRRVAPLAGRSGNTLMLAPWPRASEWAADSQAVASVDWIKGIILGLRQIRGEMDISPARKLPTLVRDATAQDQQQFTTHAALLARLAGIETLQVLSPAQTPPPAASAVVGHLTLLVPMQGLIDPATELARLQRKQEKNAQEITRARAKLTNPNFVNHAPPEVVTTERERIAQFEQVDASLERQIGIVRGLLQS